MKKKVNYQILIRVAIVLLVVLSFYFLIHKRVEPTASEDVVQDGKKEDGQQDKNQQGKEKVRIVIDAGHGGGR